MFIFPCDNLALTRTFFDVRCSLCRWPLRETFACGEVAQIPRRDQTRGRKKQAEGEADCLLVPFAFNRLGVISMIINHHWRPIFQSMIDCKRQPRWEEAGRLPQRPACAYIWTRKVETGWAAVLICLD